MKYAFFATVSTLLVILAWILSPLLAGISMLSGSRLPLGLQWFSTVDDDLDGGQRQHPDRYPADATGWSLWWQRTCWICRNPAQGFQAFLLGYSATGFFLVADDQIDGNRYREWKDVNGHTVYADQPIIRLGDKYYIKMWFGWVLKSSINRFSFKFVPFSIGVNK